MFFKCMSSTLLAGALLAAAAPARADDCKPAECTICCTEWVPVKFTCKRTVYKIETRTEKVQGYRCERVPVQKTRTCNYIEMVPETRTETRTICKRVKCEEERTVMQQHVCWKPVVRTVKKCVDRGHYECRLVECKPGLLERLCSDKCCPPCPKYKTKKVWVPCMVWEEKQVCCKEKFVECRPVKVKCCTWKTVHEQVQVQVTCCKPVCKTRTETYTCYETRKVPCEITRCVKVCVPHEETVECCRMEKRTVVKKVPCAPCCEPCCPKRRCCH